MNAPILINPCAAASARQGVLATIERYIAKALCAANRWIGEVEAQTQLKRLDDHLLRDAGLTRDDVDSGNF